MNQSNHQSANSHGTNVLASVMNTFPLNQPEPKQPKPTREHLVALGLQPVTAFLLPDKPRHGADRDRKCQLDRDRQDKSRKNRAKDGLVRIDGYALLRDAHVIRKLIKASVTGSFERELKALATGDSKEFEFVTGHTDMPAPGVESWTREILTVCGQMPPPPPLPLSRRYRIGHYVLQTKGWRRWACKLAFWQPPSLRSVISKIWRFQ